MEQKLIFTGYHDFDGKNGNHYNVLDFITEPKVSEDRKRACVIPVTIFTDSKKYSEFVNSVKLMSLVSVKCEINGDKVRYFI